MVATPQSDRLSYIFPVDLENAGDRVEEALKMQRLHPAYRADFLLQYRTSEGMVNVIIEYDGFQDTSRATARYMRVTTRVTTAPKTSRGRWCSSPTVRSSCG
jgi:hypothetical protein